MTDESERIDNIEPEPTNIEVVQFDDTVGIIDADIEVEEEIPNIYNKTDPYPDQALGKVLSRPWPMQTLTWGSNTSIGGILGVIDPTQLLSISFNKDKLNNFLFLRSATRWSFRLNTTPFHAGAVQISYHLNPTSEEITQYSADYISASMLPNFILSAGSQVPMDFVIPYAYPENYLELNNVAPYSMGAIFIHALTPLLSGNNRSESAYSTEIQVFGNLEEPEVSGMCFRAESEVNFGESSTKTFETHEDYHMTIVENNQKIYDEENSHPSVVSWQGCRPHALASVPPAKLKPISNMQHAYGIEAIEKLSMDPDNCVYSQPSHFGDPVDYDEFYNYQRIPKIKDIFIFDDNTAVNTALRSYPVTPIEFSTRDSGGQRIRTVSPACHVASHFSYWQGGMKYHFMFVCNKFVSCRIRITWTPDVSDPTSIAPGQFSEAIHSVVDIQGTTRYSFEIPYLQRTPMRLVGLGSNPRPATNGKWMLQLLNKPTSSTGETVDSTVFCVLWSSASETMRFFRPREIPQGWYAQSASTEIYDMRDVFRKSFPGIIPYSEGIKHGLVNAEEVTRWTDLFKRYSLGHNGLAALESTSYWTEPGVTGVGNSVLPMFILKQTFLYSKGSYRAKAEMNVTGPSGADYNAFVELEAFGDNLTNHKFGLTGRAFTYCKVNNWLEFEIPWYSILLMRSSTNQMVEPGYPRENFYPEFKLSHNANAVYYAVGEDFRVGFPTAPPLRIAA